MIYKKLNLGCGGDKIAGYINIDASKEVKPDLVLDFSKYKLPYQDKTVNEIIFFHTIEHIRKPLHLPILSECARVLTKGGKIFISYPNFWECAQRWHRNHKGQREFWEKTIYGRQAFPTDFHVSAIDPDELACTLMSLGFTDVNSYSEDPPNEFNSISVGTKTTKPYIKYEDLMRDAMKKVRIK